MADDDSSDFRNPLINDDIRDTADRVAAVLDYLKHLRPDPDMPGDERESFGRWLILECCSHALRAGSEIETARLVTAKALRK
jgi:hypothetical protein